MAVIKTHSSHARVGKLENYLKDHDKTNHNLQTGLNCNVDNFSYDFKDTKEFYQKDGGRRYYHVIQSFNPEDELDAQTAHEIGTKLANKTFGSKGYEVAVITHTDKNHTHNHIVINSVNLKTGKKYKSKAKQLWRIKEHSNELCKEYNLEHSIIDHTTRTNSYKRGEYEALKRGNSWKAEIGLAVVESRENALSIDEFKENMHDLGYGVKYSKTRKYITYYDLDNSRRSSRGKTLNQSFDDYDFSKQGVENEIRRNAARERETERKWERELSTLSERELEDVRKIQHHNDDEKRKQQLEKGTNQSSDQQRKYGEAAAREQGNNDINEESNREIRERSEDPQQQMDRTQSEHDPEIER
jgi:hypothetical protein